MNPSQTIAIVGLGGISPGAMNVSQFWEHVAAGRSLSSARKSSPAAGPSPRMISTPHIAPDKVYSKTRAASSTDFACDLTGLEYFASDELNSARSRCFICLLHAGKAAWQNTITKNIDPARVGIIIGNIALPTDAASAFSEEILAPLFAEKVTGTAAKNSGPQTDPLNRYVAGPAPQPFWPRPWACATIVHTRCCLCLFALRIKTRRRRTPPGATRRPHNSTGGLSRPDCLYTQMGFSQLHALSPSGNCASLRCPCRRHSLVVGEAAQGVDRTQAAGRCPAPIAITFTPPYRRHRPLQRRAPATSCSQIPPANSEPFGQPTNKPAGRPTMSISTNATAPVPPSATPSNSTASPNYGKPRPQAKNAA